MADNQQASPGPGWTQSSSGDWAPPDDKEIAYNVNATGTPAFPGPDALLSGHKQAADPRAVQAQAARAYRARYAGAGNAPPIAAPPVTPTVAYRARAKKGK